MRSDSTSNGGPPPNFDLQRGIPTPVRKGGDRKSPSKEDTLPGRSPRVCLHPPQEPLGMMRLRLS